MTQQVKRTAPRYDHYWQMAGKTIPSYTARAFTWAVNITLGVWAIGIFLFDWPQLIEQLLPIIFLVIGVSMIGAELYCGLVVSHYIRSLVASPEWNAQRRTLTEPDHAFADVYVSSQLRCWKAWTAEIMIRTVSAAFVFFVTIQCFMQGAGSSLISLIALLILVILIFEARWRFTVVVATSIAVSTRISSFVLAALATTVGLHTFQLLIILLPLCILLLGNLGFQLLAFFGLPLSPFWVIVVTFWLYRTARDRALTYAQRELFRPE